MPRRIGATPSGHPALGAAGSATSARRRAASLSCRRQLCSSRRDRVRTRRQAGARPDRKDFEVSKTETASDRVVQARPGPPRRCQVRKPPRQIRTNSDEEVEASRDDARVIAIFLDDYHVRRINSMKVRQPLLEFIENRLSPTDILAVMHPLTPLTEVRLTRNHASVASAIARFEGRKFDYQPMNDIEARVRTLPGQRGGADSDADHDGCDEGVGDPGAACARGKAMLVVSEGFVGRLPAQLADPLPINPVSTTRTGRIHLRAPGTRPETFCAVRYQPRSAGSATLPIGTTRLSTHSIRAGSPARNSVSTRTSTTRPIGDS